MSLTSNFSHFPKATQFVSAPPTFTVAALITGFSVKLQKLIPAVWNVCFFYPHFFLFHFKVKQASKTKLRQPLFSWYSKQLWMKTMRNKKGLMNLAQSTSRILRFFSYFQLIYAHHVLLRSAACDSFVLDATGSAVLWGESSWEAAATNEPNSKIWKIQNRAAQQLITERSSNIRRGDPSSALRSTGAGSFLWSVLIKISSRRRSAAFSCLQVFCFYFTSWVHF